MSHLVLCCVQMSVLPIIFWYVWLKPLVLYALFLSVRGGVTLSLIIAQTCVITRSYLVA